MSAADAAEQRPPLSPDPPLPEVPLLTLREGLPPVVETRTQLEAAVETLHGGTGPLALDAERASGYRYSPRAYLLQIRRTGSGTTLVDPTRIDDFSALAAVLADDEWILHAASQDLPCLADLGLRPRALFDTELAGRLLGYPRVGLATLVETVLGWRLRKEHSAVDWSTRPLPEPWLEYAALDVEVLVELREALGEQLTQAGKAEWAAQEFAHLMTLAPSGPRQDPWRRTSGMHRARGRRALAAVRALWQTRDSIASNKDVTPSRLISDSAIVEAANALPRHRAALLGLKGFHGRGAQRYATQWLAALQSARDLADEELPPVAARYDGPPPPRVWPDRDPVAAARLSRVRTELAALAEAHTLPVENLVSPDYVRRLLWDPPATDRVSDVSLLADVEERLRVLGARPWQVELTAPVLCRVIAEVTTPAPAHPPARPPAPGERSSARQ